jgi:TP901 family phage tail tape measure protein
MSDFQVSLTFSPETQSLMTALSNLTKAVTGFEEASTSAKKELEAGLQQSQKQVQSLNQRLVELYAARAKGDQTVALQAEIQATDKLIQSADQDIRKMSDALKGMEGAEDGAGAKGQALSASQLLLAEGIRAVYQAVQSAVGVFTDFETQMANVRTLTNLTDQEFGALTQSVMDLSKRVPQSGSELSKGLYQLLSAGVDARNGMGALEAASRAAQAGLSSVHDAADVGTSVMNAYGASVDKLPRIYDTMFRTVAIGKTTFPELAASMGLVINQAATFKVSFEEVTAAIATMTNAGVRTPQAVTSIARAIEELKTPKSEEARLAMQQLGVTYTTFSDTIRQLKEKNLGPEDWQHLIPDVRAVRGVMALVNNYERFQDILGQVRESQGATDAAFAIQADTTAAKLSELKNSWEALFNSALGGIATVLRPLAGILASVANGLDALPGPVKAVGVGLIALEGATFAAVAALRALGVTVSVGMGPLSAIIAVIGMVAGGLLYMADAEDREHQASLRNNAAMKSRTESAQTLSRQYDELATKMDKGGLSTKEAEKTESQLKATKEKMIELFPEYRDKLEKLTGSYQEQNKALKELAETEAKRKHLSEEVLAAQLEAAKKAVQTARDDARRAYSTQNAQLGARFGGRYAQKAVAPVAESTVENDSGVQSAIASVARLQAEYDALTGKVKGVAQATGDLNTLTDEFANKTDRHLKQRITQEEIAYKLAQDQLAAMPKETLEQERQLALKHSEVELQHKLAELAKENKADKFANPQDFLNLQTAATTAARAQQDNINAHFDAEAARRSQELQAKLTANEHEGLESRLAAVRASFEKLREEDRKLRTGRETESDLLRRKSEIDAAERVAIETATNEKIRQDVGRLRSELEELAKAKGRALTTDEQLASLDQLAEKFHLTAQAVQELREELERRSDGQGGWMAGITEFIEQGRNAFETFRHTATSVMQGVEQSFARGFQGMLSGQMTFSQGMKAIWQGIVQTVIQALAQLAAKYLVTAIAARLFGEQSAEGAKQQAVGSQIAAAAGIFQAHSAIPFVGPIIAAAYVAMMNAALVANAASATSITARRVGGLVTSPEVTLLGEDGPELVAPESDFKDWAQDLVSLGALHANLGQNLRREEQVVEGYHAQSSSYAAQASEQQGSVKDPGPAAPDTTLHINMSGATILDASSRGLETLGNHIMDALQLVAQRRGWSVTPGLVFGGI